MRHKNNALQHHFPQDLARAVSESWDAFIHGPEYDRPQLPSELHLTQILEACYLAGLETDEGRSLCFCVCCTPQVNEVRRHNSAEVVEAWCFQTAREFNVQELRRLASTTNLDTSAIWVRFAEKVRPAIAIHGLVNYGSSWSSARRAFAYAYSSPPSALMVRAYGPGRLSVYQGGYSLATLASGRVSPANSNDIVFLQLLGAYPIFQEGADAIGNALIRPTHEDPSEWHNFEWTAYINTILAVVNAIQLRGHGGALIITTEAARIWEGPTNSVKLKYPMQERATELKDRLIAFLNARHRLGDLHHIYEFGDDAPDENTLFISDVEVKERARELSGSAAFLGGLSGADGAIVLTSSLELIGFGAEILMDRAQKSPVYQTVETTQNDLQELDSEQFGMRHRSAMRLCGTSEGILVFVVSQDGDVSLVWKENGKVRFRKGIRTTNPDMPFS